MSKQTAPKGRSLLSMRRLQANWELLLLCIPAIVVYIIFSYVPMIGLVLPFKNYKYNLGLFGSKWVGLKNFGFLFRSVDLWRITRNTVSYSLVFMVVGTIVNIGVALLLFEIKERRSSLKLYQTIMTFPNFMSWVIVGFITYAIFNPALGVLNQILRAFGGTNVDVYLGTAEAVEAKYNEYVDKLKAAGVDTIIAAIQEQVTAFTEGKSWPKAN